MEFDAAVPKLNIHIGVSCDNNFSGRAQARSDCRARLGALQRLGGFEPAVLGRLDGRAERGLALQQRFQLVARQPIGGAVGERAASLARSAVSCSSARSAALAAWRSGASSARSAAPR